MDQVLWMADPEEKWMGTTKQSSSRKLKGWGAPDFDAHDLMTIDQIVLSSIIWILYPALL